MVFLNVVKALYTYESSQEDEISFQEDDILYVTEENDADWWSAVLKKDSERVHGLVPSNYFEQVCSEAQHEGFSCGLRKVSI